MEEKKGIQLDGERVSRISEDRVSEDKVSEDKVGGNRDRKINQITQKYLRADDDHISRIMNLEQKVEQLESEKRVLKEKLKEQKYQKYEKVRQIS